MGTKWTVSVNNSAFYTIKLVATFMPFYTMLMTPICFCCFWIVSMPTKMPYKLKRNKMIGERIWKFIVNVLYRHRIKVIKTMMSCICLICILALLSRKKSYREKIITIATIKVNMPEKKESVLCTFFCFCFSSALMRNAIIDKAISI